MGSREAFQGHLFHSPGSKQESPKEGNATSFLACHSQ